MGIQNGKKIKIIDITPDIKTDTFVNEEYKEAIIGDIQHYLEFQNKDMLREMAQERLNLIK